MDTGSKIFVAGHRGLVGSALCRQLALHGYENIVTRTSVELDLRSQAAVAAFFEEEKPEYVFLAAARVGGIYANDTYPADFIYDNLMIESNVINSAYKSGVKKLLFLGSSCIYPKYAEQPIKESSLLTGALEATTEWYGIAKIAGIRMCQAFRKQYDFDAISAMPCNLYGEGDNFHPQNAHVFPAFIRRFHEAQMNGVEEVTIWGSGTPTREFLYVGDMADACIFMMNEYSGHDHLNVGSGREISIYDLAKMVAECVGYEGKIALDKSMPDGTPRKVMDNSNLLALGWQPKVSLREGVERTFNWYKKHAADARV